MPQSTVASQPALQWVSTRSGCPCRSGGRAAASCWKSASPWSPIASHIATSSSAMRPASSPAAAARCVGGNGTTRSRTRSKAHCKFTAVGRVASNVSNAAARDPSPGSSCNASINP